jgi:hypothetical protein
LALGQSALSQKRRSGFQMQFSDSLPPVAPNSKKGGSPPALFLGRRRLNLTEIYGPVDHILEYRIEMERFWSVLRSHGDEPSNSEKIMNFWIIN